MGADGSSVNLQFAVAENRSRRSSRYTSSQRGVLASSLAGLEMWPTQVGRDMDPEQSMWLTDRDPKPGIEKDNDPAFFTTQFPNKHTRYVSAGEIFEMCDGVRTKQMTLAELPGWGGLVYQLCTGEVSLLVIAMDGLVLRPDSPAGPHAGAKSGWNRRLGSEARYWHVLPLTIRCLIRAPFPLPPHKPLSLTLYS